VSSLFVEELTKWSMGGHPFPTATQSLQPNQTSFILSVLTERAHSLRERGNSVTSFDDLVAFTAQALSLATPEEIGAVGLHRWARSLSAVLLYPCKEQVRQALAHGLEAVLRGFSRAYSGNNAMTDDDNSDDDDDEGGARRVITGEECEALFSGFREHVFLHHRGRHPAALPGWAVAFSPLSLWCAALEDVGLGAVLGEMAMSVVQASVRQSIHRASGGPAARVLSGILSLVKDVMEPFLLAVFSMTSRGPAGLDGVIESFAYEAFAWVTTASLFDHIVDFPDSRPVMEDLAQVVQARPHLKGEIIQTLLGAYTKRLLHPGANTVDIIDQFVNTVRALRIVDPSGVTLEVVGEPIRRYLRSREDTIRSIVTLITDDKDGGSELFTQLGDRETQLDDDDDSDDGGGPEGAWVPDPVDADPSKPSKSRKTTDVISMLVNIYGSKDLFVAEYRYLLAERLIASRYETDRDIRTLELLKLRFGEGSLGQCEIMVRDIAESKRINANIHSVIKRTTPVNADPALHTEGLVDAYVLSRLFWPANLMALQEFTVPDRIRRHLAEYTGQYEALKGSRKLVWLHSLGQVTLDIHGTDGSVTEYTATPLQASVISAFELQDEWEAGALAQHMAVTGPVLAKAAGFWVNRSVLAETTTLIGRCYALAAPRSAAEAASSRSAGNLSGAAMEDDSTPISGAMAALALEMATYESYIIGMLTNYDTSTLEKLNNLLSMVIEDYDKQPHELADFLKKMVKDDKLDYEDGLYSLKGKKRK
jgi:hypothetical protein